VAAAPTADDNHDRSLFYTLAFSSGAGELWTIEVDGKKISTKDIGPINTVGCATLAMSPSGTLMSMCGPLLPGDQQLTSFDTKTGQATLFGVHVPRLAVMSMAFGPDGVLYAVGDCDQLNSASDCGTGSDPNYNSLYTVNVVTGAFTRVGPTGAPEFFMDMVFDRHGILWGVTSCLSPCYAPAVLYRINTETGKATKVVNLVGSNTVMGLAFARDGKLYANDFVGNSGFYLIDPKTGFETTVAALPFGLAGGLELADPLP
jgi:hypothetical protein